MTFISINKLLIYSSWSYMPDDFNCPWGFIKVLYTHLSRVTQEDRESIKAGFCVHFYLTLGEQI